MSKYFSGEKWRYPFYILTHPADGFYEIRHREQGSVPIALLITAVFSFCYSMNRILAGFVINDTDPRTVDSMKELSAVFALFFLFCVGNWSVTCLMEGEGRFKDIVTVTGYAQLPLILAYLPATLISQVIASKEEAFYSLILWVGIAWTVVLLLIGIMTVHNYTFAKTLVTFFFTFVAMLIIIFVIMMLQSLISQVYGFFYSLYTELVFRS